MQPALELDELRSGYGDVQVLDGVSLALMPGEIVALIGANGVGKTTLLRTVSGLVRATAGTVTLYGERIDKLPAHRITAAGFVQSPEGKQLFTGMTIEENLMVGAHNDRAYPRMKTTMEEVYQLFPILAERRHKLASTLSGGQQQMLAVGRALMARPKVLALDEPSLGLAPLMVDRLFEAIGEVRKLDISILIIEQNVFQVLSMADRGYVLERGKVMLSGTGRELLENEHLRSTYLGI
ncbi:MULTISPECIES: ABC transporter ATP-binding protein [Xanthobacter]|uniref:ABC transporter ATP-binding protein n=1 Tax=Xanthobacter TaxID=279 RepID=UPI002022FD7E|nr:ABC transporter ATP-binding protein [Xanthobacter aminoxidans]MCL8383450.1 ABC transporter ATP-binding protein [Xanthobacter aminoxidans]